MTSKIEFRNLYDDQDYQVKTYQQISNYPIEDFISDGYWNFDNYFKVKVKQIRCNFLYIKLYHPIQ